VQVSRRRFPENQPYRICPFLLVPTFALAEVAAGAPPEAAPTPEQRTAQELEQIRVSLEYSWAPLKTSEAVTDAPLHLRTFRNRIGNKPESSRPNKHAEFAAREFLEVSSFLPGSASGNSPKSLPAPSPIAGAMFWD